ncbi:hypothetical protein AX289_24615 [Methylorubrum populi]|nr:hypothetical protein AX289_24615 [Methylorubrum populi]
MARLALYRIIDQPNGQLAVKVTLVPDKVFTRTNLGSLVEVHRAVDGLRTLMSACGAELILDPAASMVVSHKAACTSLSDAA